MRKSLNLIIFLKLKVKLVLFKCLTAFAAGSLLGDVFIHLLPEMYIETRYQSFNYLSLKNGIWTVLGVLTFLSVEKFFPEDDDADDENDNESDKNQMISDDDINYIKKDTKQTINKTTYFQSIKVISKEMSNLLKKSFLIPF
jgi:hypothetical protein